MCVGDLGETDGRTCEDATMILLPGETPTTKPGDAMMADAPFICQEDCSSDHHEVEDRVATLIGDGALVLTYNAQVFARLS